MKIIGLKGRRLLAMGLVALCFGEFALAQDKAEFSVGGDIVSRYIWRGQDLGSAAIQPGMGVDYKGLGVSAWGSYGFADASDVKEFDLTVSYTIKGFSIGLTDYWFSEGLDPQGRYFKYDAHGTNHLFEAFAGYDFGPVAILWCTNVAGNDGLNKKGERAYSSYFEVSAPFSAGGFDFTAALGMVPYATSYYGTKGFAVTNVSFQATKGIRINDSFSIPIYAEVVANPCSQHAYLVFGLTLHN